MNADYEAKRRAVVLEAIKELNTSYGPDFYHRVKRLARKYIKRQVVEPIDMINWPKGCLAVGLMSQVRYLTGVESSEAQALTVYACAEVKDYLDRWIVTRSPIYTLDDCLMGCALLDLIGILREEEDINNQIGRYEAVAQKMMSFLYQHRVDPEGSLPYRPGQTTDDIYADGIGMMVPYAIKYGQLMNDEAAVDFGMTQIRNYMKYGLDNDTGLPYHAYSIKTDTDDSESQVQYGKSLGWGRALGWVIYGIRRAYESLDNGKIYKAELEGILKDISDVAVRYQREDGLFGSNLLEVDSPIDTSASAMILYGMRGFGLHAEQACNKIKEVYGQYITDDGLVMQAQGECQGLGLYSEQDGSYPWSVGMTLNIW